ncbi:MAG: TetR family transcriptional regulator [Flavobacteriaceae bacterium]|nr:TetR family transcriptional regulator [Flavobacteriaceae bacterium]
MQTHSKKEKFFHAALTLFHEKGFKATTMRDIAEKLEFEVANIYNYIDSKDALLENYLFSMSAKFHKNIDRILQSTYPPLEKLKLIIAMHIQLAADKPYETALVQNEWRNLPIEKRVLFLEERNAYEGKFQSVLEACKEEKSIREIDTKLATNAMLAAIRWTYDMFTEEHVDKNPLEVQKQITDLLLAGVLDAS